MDQKRAGFYFRAGREVKAMREDCPTGKEERLENLLHEGLELQVAEKKKEKRNLSKDDSLWEILFFS
jgi:hypothetical protein